MTHRVAFLAFDGVTLLDVTGPLEVLHQAGRLGHAYRPVLVSPRGGDVTASSGAALARTVPAADAGPVDRMDGSAWTPRTCSPRDHRAAPAP